MDTDESKPAISQEFLKKYILYAKTNCTPKLNDIDTEKISKLYSDLRAQAQATGSLPITPRYMDAIMRLSQAHARMHLREVVRDDDVDMVCLLTAVAVLTPHQGHSHCCHFLCRVTEVQRDEGHAKAL